MMSDSFRPEQLADPTSFANPAHVNALYRHLRREQPLARAEPAGYRPFWVLTRHADIAAVEREAAVYLAGPRTVLLPEKVEGIYQAKYGDPNGVKPLTHMDGDYHRAHRAVTTEWFTAKNLKAFEPTVAMLAKEFVDRMEDHGGSCDFAADIAYWFPLRVILTLMGVPREDEAEVLRMTQRLLSPADKSLKARTAEQGADGQAKVRGGDVVADFAAYFHDLAAHRRQHPTRDIISTIANGQVGGCPMARHEMTSYFVIVSTAGHDTTAASLSGGLQALIETPDELTKLRGDLSLLQTAAEEFVRITAPVKHFMRTPNQDVEWHGQTISAGDAVMLCYASACRDETVFADADLLRVDRPPNPGHLAFGFGPHFCLGRALATMEIRSFYRELLGRLKGIELAGTPSFIQSVFVSGHKSLPVTYRF